LFAKPSEILCHEIYCHLPKSSTSYCINKTAKTRGLLVLERDPVMPVSSHRYLKFVTAHCRGAIIQIHPWRHLAPSLTHLKFHIPFHQHSGNQGNPLLLLLGFTVHFATLCNCAPASPLQCTAEKHCGPLLIAVLMNVLAIYIARAEL
jgi:hypothetical protein